MARATLSALLAVALAACGNTSGGGIDAPGGGDTDGDTIGNDDEGAPTVDTDGDGTPDYQDTDADGDGVDDYREAGDTSVVTPPVDSDGDGVPDFRDTDSDGNGIADGVDGTGDADGDGRPDFQDTDDDNDGLTDAIEVGDPAAPRDSDGDGIPDYRDTDSDADGLPDAGEGTGDADGDGVGDWMDPRNDAPPPAISFTAISTTFNSPIGIDYHEPTDSVVMSVNYPSGTPSNFERVQLDGSHVQFSTFSGMTDEVKIATVRSGNVGGFVAGDLFVGNGNDGQIARITDNGATVISPWVTLPGTGPHGLMRGSLYVDRTGVFGGDLIVVTTVGEVWRITSAGVPTRIAAVGVHLEGMIVVPPYPARFGPLAGKILASAEEQHQIWAFDAAGTSTVYDLGAFAVEDIDLVMPDENFFGVNYGTSRLLGVPREAWRPMIGDVLLTTETVAAGLTGLARVYWDGTTLSAQLIPLAPGSATVGQWEHTTFAGAGIVEIP